jgi:hypothetical protein
MKILFGPQLALVTALAVAGSVYASDIPPNVVNSDALGNTAMGSGAMGVSTSGKNNTAAGDSALDSDNAGSNNTAVGASALTANNDGSNNTAVGFEALLLNNSSNNTATGYQALFTDSTGNSNTATGDSALYNNNGSSNTAAGVNALYANTSGDENTAVGQGALKANTTGSSNIALGFQAGFDLTSGSNNIDIGNVGAAGESGKIRIGAAAQTATFIAGISSTKLTGSAVYVTTSGQLGVLASSERYKTAIAPMGSDTTKLDELRPVSFKLKSDATGTRQYGLIAEEVAKVYPELVIRDASGRIDGVRYDELAPMLLNEMQQQRAQMNAKINAQAAEMNHLKSQVAQLHDLQQQMAAMSATLQKLQSQDTFVAQR